MWPQRFHFRPWLIEIDTVGQNLVKIDVFDVRACGFLSLTPPLIQGLRSVRRKLLICKRVAARVSCQAMADRDRHCWPEFGEDRCLRCPSLS
eukprot:s1922_g8.t1